MDSDHPDFRQLLAVCRTHRAHLMVDVAHDLGLLGPNGRGVLAEQDVLDQIDFLVGSFSKTFACIGGFFASRGKGTAYQVRGFSGSHTFSNFLIPARMAAVRAAPQLVRSSEVEVLRRSTLLLRVTRRHTEEQLVDAAAVVADAIASARRKCTTEDRGPSTR